jgi:hypothetical protein
MFWKDLIETPDNLLAELPNTVYSGSLQGHVTIELPTAVSYNANRHSYLIRSDLFIGLQE